MELYPIFIIKFYFVRKVKFTFTFTQQMKNLKRHKEKYLFLKMKQATFLIKKAKFLTAGHSDTSD
jgi:hypothetical protein